jgi:hypothetical protein
MVRHAAKRGVGIGFFASFRRRFNPDTPFKFNELRWNSQRHHANRLRLHARQALRPALELPPWKAAAA